MTEHVEFKVSIPSSLHEGLALQDRIVQLMERFAYSPRDVFAVRLSFEEGLANAIKHGNQLDESKLVMISCRIDDNRMRVEIQDQGAGFEPQAVPDPTQDEFIERSTGRGLLLMRVYMDHSEYADGGRCLIMERQRNSPLPITEN
ncbi:MAG: ATP-binding protein [Planctomycetota bacterium]|nr:MAG: ATP-binding protein [Planctomycetota bacterium]